MPNTLPIIDNPELVQFIFDKTSSLPIDIYPIGAITKKLEGIELAELGSMINAGAVALSDADFPIMNSQVMRYALEYAKMFDVPVINHPQDIHLVNNGVMNESSISNSLGRIKAQDLLNKIDEISFKRKSSPLISGVSITQLAENGTLYTLDEIGAISEICKKNNLYLHMDGARFSNALVSHELISAAEATWKVGVDCLSLGATKNGAMAAELIVFFNKSLAFIPFSDPISGKIGFEGRGLKSHL